MEMPWEQARLRAKIVFRPVSKRTRLEQSIMGAIKTLGMVGTTWDKLCYGQVQPHCGDVQAGAQELHFDAGVVCGG
eukprot:3783909-Amphidinium_carterae.1